MTSYYFEPALQDLFDVNDYYQFEVDDKPAKKIIDKLESAVDSLADTVCFQSKK